MEGPTIFCSITNSTFTSFTQQKSKHDLTLNTFLLTKECCCPAVICQVHSHTHLYNMTLYNMVKVVFQYTGVLTRFTERAGCSEGKGSQEGKEGAVKQQANEVNQSCHLPLPF